MDKKYEQKYHSIEDHYWWFVGRHEALLKLLGREKGRILDVGCSNGSFLALLQQNGYHAEGIDISPEAVERCKKRGLTVRLGDAQATKYPDNTFDVIISSDVLENLPDDKKAAKEWLRILKPGGKVIAFAVAYPILYGEHDRINHSFRRYTDKQYKSLFSGYHIEKFSHWNLFLTLPMGIMRLLIKGSKKAKDQLYDVPKWISFLLLSVLRLENALISVCSLPFGLSVLVVARKPK